MNNFKNNFGYFFLYLVRRTAIFGDEFTRNFGELFLITILDNFGKLIYGLFLGITLGISFGVVESCSGAASRTSFGEQISGRIL